MAVVDRIQVEGNTGFLFARLLKLSCASLATGDSDMAMKRRRWQLMKAAIAATAFLMLASPVLAADFETPAAYDWTGPYIGLQGGYGWGSTDYRFETVTTHEMKFDGFVGGLTGGYNWQAGQIVLGAEFDISYADLSEEIRLSQDPGNELCFAEGCSLDIDWFGTARLRLGYAADTVMPFITGGLAFAGVEGTFDSGPCECSIDETAVGWTVGGGIEWAFAERWSTKAEYLYVDLGEPDKDGNPDIIDNVSTSSFDFSVIRLGVNYRL
jgi:outer membrane immunogenic protein